MKTDNKTLASEQANILATSDASVQALSCEQAASVCEHDTACSKMAANGISRRAFVGAAAIAGAAVAASTGGLDIVHPKGAFADENSPIEKRYTYCDMCNHVPKCGIVAHVKEDKVVRIEPRGKYPSGPICAKGVASLQELYDPHRLLTPKVRTNAKGTGKPEWKDITWDEAYDTIVQKFNASKEKYGPDSVLFFCGDPKEPRGAMQRVATLFGSTSYGTESSVCAAASWMCAQMVFGQNSMGQDPGDKTASALVWTLNPAWSQPYRFSQFMAQKERGCKFVVVDPRITPTVTGLADIHLQLRPGSDGALLAGWINQMIEQNLVDMDFVKNWTIGYDELAEYVKEYTPAKVEEITWVPADKLIAAVKLIGENHPMTLVTSSKGGCHQTNVGNFQRGVFMLPALFGDLDVAGGLMLGPGLPFDYAASTAAFQLEPMYVEKDYAARRHDRDDFPVWAKYYKMMQTDKLPEYVADGKIRVGLLLGINSMMWPNTPLYQKAIMDMEFTCAIDYYIRDWTHDYVDMVLPAAMCYERTAALSIFGRKIFLRQPVVTPLGEAREDWQIILEIGTALGYGEECFYGNVDDALDELLRTANVGVTVADLKAAPEGIEIPGGVTGERKYADGKLRKDGEPGFNTQSGKVELSSEVLKSFGFEGIPRFVEPVQNPKSPEASKYPLVLSTGSRVPFYTHSKLRDVPWLNQFMPDPVVRMNPKDVASRGLKDGQEVKVFNQQGEIQMFVEETNMVMPGVVDIFHGWHQADVNKLTTRDFDPITGFPPFTCGLCEVAKV